MTLLQALLLGFVASAPSLVIRHQDDVLRQEEGLEQCSLSQEVSSEVSASPASCNAFALSRGAPGVDKVSFIKVSKPTKEQTEWTNGLEPKDDAVQAYDPQNQLGVWVSGYPRSGSSTILSMVSATMDDNQEPGKTFSVFEPCHDGDQYAKWLTDKKGNNSAATCSYVLKGLSQCDFTGVDNLWGWWDPHSTNNHSKFNGDHAHAMCVDANVVAFKTVDYGHTLKDWTWFLDDHPNMRVLDVVRDPRGIYASWKTLEPFATLIKEGDHGKPFYTLTEICDHFAMNLDLKDDRVHRVLFEELMDNPYDVTKEVYAFLGLPFGKPQYDWIENVFNNTECPPPPPGMEGFTDCHENSGSEVVERWRTVLDDEELNLWKNHHRCQQVAEAYNFRD